MQYLQMMQDTSISEEKAFGCMDFFNFSIPFLGLDH